MTYSNIKQYIINGVDKGTNIEKNRAQREITKEEHEELKKQIELFIKEFGRADLWNRSVSDLKLPKPKREKKFKKDNISRKEWIDSVINGSPEDDYDYLAYPEMIDKELKRIYYSIVGVFIFLVVSLVGLYFFSAAAGFLK